MLDGLSTWILKSSKIMTGNDGDDDREPGIKRFNESADARGSMTAMGRGIEWHGMIYGSQRRFGKRKGKQPGSSNEVTHHPPGSTVWDVTRGKQWPQKILGKTRFIEKFD
jgi:hypothetical protein